MFHLQRNRVPECNGAKSDGLNEDAARKARQGFQFSRIFIDFYFFSGYTVFWVWSNPPPPNNLILDPTHGLITMFQNLVQMEIRQEDLLYIYMYSIIGILLRILLQ
jgi:hypothetical protein